MRLEHTRLFAVNDRLESQVHKGHLFEKYLSIDEADKPGYHF